MGRAGTIGFADRKVRGVRIMKSDMVAVQRIWPKAHVIDSHQVANVLEVFHDRVERMAVVLRREGRVRGCLHADDAALPGDRFDDLIGRHPIRIPKGTRPDVGEHDRLLASGGCVDGGPTPSMRTVNQHPDLVHSLDGLAPEAREAAIVRLLQASAQHVTLAIGHPEATDAKAVEHVDPVELVFDHRGTFEMTDPGNSPFPMGPLDISDRFGVEEEVLVSNVTEPEPEVLDHLGPFPAALRVEVEEPVKEAVEDGVPVAVAQPFEPGRQSALAGVVAGIIHPLGKHHQMVVERDVNVLLEVLLDPLLLGLIEPDRTRGDPVELGGEFKGSVVRAGLQIGPGSVGRGSLTEAHGNRSGEKLANCSADPGRVKREGTRTGAAPVPDCGG